MKILFLCLWNETIENLKLQLEINSVFYVNVNSSNEIKSIEIHIVKQT